MKYALILCLYYYSKIRQHGQGIYILGGSSRNSDIGESVHTQIKDIRYLEFGVQEPCHSESSISVAFELHVN